MIPIDKIKRRYRFDIRSGHYIRLNEADESGNAGQETAPEQNKEEQTPSEQHAPVTNIDTEKVAQLRQQMDSEAKRHDDSIRKNNDLLNQLTSKHSEALEKAAADTSIDPKIADSILKQILQCRKQIADAEFEKARVIHDYTVKILGEQSSLLESMYRLPGKYSALNESNIHSAKVYISALVGNDDFHIMKGMVDVKRVFRHSQLFYGKDQNGYFILCIDQEDFDRLYTALQEAGYSREDIIDAIMPQVFDRRELVK